MLAFLSYSRRDRELIDRFQTVLEQSGVTVWRDTDDIRGGQEWRTSIVAAIHAADVLVLFVSPGSMASVNVRRELTVAEEESKRIIPVLLLPTPIPDDFRYSLAGVQYVDVTNMPIEEASARVRDAVVTPPPVSAAPEFRRQPSPRPAVATETQPSAPDGASRRRWAIGVVSAIVVAACVVLAFALVGHGTDDRSTTPTTAGPLESTGTAAAANVGAETRVVDQRFGYGAFAIHLGQATRRENTVTIDAEFENLAPSDFQVDPSHISLVSKGNVYGWSGDPVPTVPGHAKTNGTLGFSVSGPFDFADAKLVAGSGDQNQAVVPLAGGRGAKLLSPRTLKVTGKATAGTLTVEIVGGQVSAGDFEFNQQAVKGRVFVHLDLRAATAEKYGDNFVGDHLVLALPDGEQVAPTGGSNVVLVTGATTPELFADFEVPEPATGDFVLVVRQQDARAEIPFTLR